MPLTLQPATAQAELLTSVMWHSDSPMFLFDSAGQLIFVNRAGITLARLTPEQETSARMDSLFEASTHDIKISDFHGIFESTLEELEVGVAQTDGARSKVRLRLQRLSVADGTRHLLCTAEEIAKRNGHRERYEQILVRISAEVISDKPISEVLEQVARAMVEVAQVDHATITLLDDKREYFEIKAEHPSMTTPPLIGARIPIKGSATQESILRDMAPVSAVDLRAHPVARESKRVAELARQLGIESMLIVPMVYKDQVIGTISVDWTDRQLQFTPELIAMYQGIANQAAVAVENARLFETGQRLSRQAQLLMGSSELPYAQDAPEEVAESLLQELGTFLEFQKAGVQLIENDERVLLAAKGFDKKTASQSLLRRINTDPIIREIVRSKASKVLADTSDPKDWKTPQTWNVNSWMGIPIVANDVTIAVITLDHDVAGYYATLSNETRQRLQRTVDQASVDLHAALLKRQIQGLELLQKVASEVLKATEVDDVLRQIVTGAMQVTHRDSGVIYLVENGIITRKFTPQPLDHPEPRMALDSGITQAVIATKEVIEIPNFAIDPRVNPELRGKYRSMIAIPLTLDDAVVGVLYLNGREEGVLTAIERSLVSTLAHQAAIVVERTRLYQKLHESYQQIRDSEAEYHSLLDHIPQCVFRKDKNYKFISANKAFCESLSRPLSEIVGKCDADFYDADLALTYVKDDEFVINTGETLRREERHQSKTMSAPIWVRVVKTPVRDADENISGVQAIFWDVDLEKTMDERYRSLVHQSPDSIILLRKGAISLANPAALKLLGVDRESDLEGRSLLEFIGQRHLPLATERLAKLSRGEKVDQMVEMTITNGDRRPIDVAVYALPLPDSNEIQVVFHDLTRVNSLLKEMRHRVRDALNAVKGCLHFTQEPENPLIQKLITSVEQRIHAMAHLHTILLPQRNHVDVPMERYLDDLTQAVLSAYGDGRDGIRRKVIVEDGLRFDEKSALWCGLIVSELVSNAIVHGFRGRKAGNIEVQLSKLGDSLCMLLVKDDGCGFEGLAKERSESGGLGLVHGFVNDELQGQLKFASSEHGTTFEIKFPLKPTEAAHGG